MSSFELRPLWRYRVPAYPTRLEIDEDPTLLKRHVPPAWLTRREIAALLGLTLGANAAGCSDAGTSTGAGGTKSLKPDRPAVVAPVFKHGEGRAEVGYCGVGNPVGVIPEDEALSIIREELGREGVQLTERKVVMSEIKIPKRQRDYQMDWVTKERVETPGSDCGPEEPLQADLRDPARQVVVEYLTEYDYEHIDIPPDGHLYTEYDLPELASRVNRFVRRDGKGAYVGVLYDPTATREMPQNLDLGQAMRWSAEQRAPLNAESRRLLRLQVRDFIDWLKAQGAI